MRETTRLVTTAVIWTAFTLIMGVITLAVATASEPLDAIGGVIVLAIVLVLTAAVTISTRAVWQSAEPDTQSTAREKLKRADRERIARLLDALDEDDIYDLEALIGARQEEAQHRQRR